MTYRLELNQADHKQLLSDFLQKWTEERSPDLMLVPIEGPTLSAHSLPLSLHSPTLRSILASVNLKESLSISVAATSTSLTMLLQFLSSGFVIGRSREEVAEVQEAAKALGLILGDCQVGTKRSSMESMAVLETKQEMSDEFSMEGTKIKEISAAFTCKECGKQYKFVKALQNHVKKHKLGTVAVGQFECPQCGLELGTGALLAEHRISVHGTKQEVAEFDNSAESLDIGVAMRLPCTYCDKTFSRKDKVNSHVRKVHCDRDTLDESSGPQSDTVDELIEKIHTCDACPKAYKNSSHLLRHKLGAHSNVIMSCDHCGKHFSRRDKLNAHMKNIH